VSRDHWERHSWGELASLEYGKALRGYRKGVGIGYRVYGTNGPIGWHSQPLFRGPGVIVGRKGAYRGIFFSKDPCWVIDTAFYLNIRDLEKVDPKFAFYQLKTVNLDDIDSGSAIPSTSRAAFYAIPIELPPLPIQHKMVALLSTYDDLLENNNRQINVLEEMARRIYYEWFVEFRYPGHDTVRLVNSQLGPAPDGWQIVSLEEICDLMKAGATPSRSRAVYWTDGTNDWFTTNELQDGFLLRSTEQVTDAALADRKTHVFRSGTILMAIYGSPTVGRLGVLVTDGCCNQAALAMRSREERVPQMALFYLLMNLRDHFNRIAHGAAQQNISKEKVGATRVLCPPAALLSHWADLIRPLWQQRLVLTKAVSNLKSSRDLLLPRLISGEIDVTELNVALPAPAD